MRLERIEINGFKSFSDRSELAFDKGVTAIVGPNGCGKSNVADAITWVMGEQSAKSLRGDRMEDVIFNGSDARKPTAAAEVRLRFSGLLKTLTGPAFPDDHGNGNGNGHGNGRVPVVSGFSRTDPETGVPGSGRTDAEQIARAEAEEVIQSVAREVEVTRRLYRSGESEYLIDGRLCRLRDVHELLMDTGLGAKAYAIIEQGKIGLILSSRPIDRRQLIEEAAGVTKYKSRRRAAELKLEAAQQNLTRIDDIVFEVGKQRGALKRQAARAARYRKLRDELRRWEKVLFAKKYRRLAETIESARGRLAAAREREAAAAAHVNEVESDLNRMRLELMDAESRAAAHREAAHACELAINRRQQQIAFDLEQVQVLEGRTTAVNAEIEALASRREPARAVLHARREAASQAAAERDRAAAALLADSSAYEAAHRDIEGLEADVEAARSEVFSAINAATALHHALEHAADARDRVAERLSKLDVEIADVRIESDRVGADRASAAEAVRRGQEAIEATRLARAARESELASAQIEHEWRARSVRTREHDLARLEARLKSLEELEAARAAYGDATRTVLAEANGKVGQQGAIADYLDVAAGYERPVEACLADLLQHVIVERSDQAAAGFQLVREQDAGRCGFLIISPPDLVPGVGAELARPADLGSGVGADVGRTIEQNVNTPGPQDSLALVRLSSVVGVTGRFSEPIRGVIGDAWIAGSYDRAAEASRLTDLPVVTMSGEVFHGPHLVTGGSRAEARGILETRREIRDLRDRIQLERDALAGLADETVQFEAAIAQASTAIAALGAEHHKQEKAIVAHDAQLQRAIEDALRLGQKAEQLAREHRQADDERDVLNRREAEARASIVQLEQAQRTADERLTTAQRRLFEAREASEDLSRRAADAGASHAALVERAAALTSEVERLEEAAAELESRAQALEIERAQTERRLEELRTACAADRQQLDLDARTLEDLRHDLQTSGGEVSALRTRTEDHDARIKDARGALDSLRATVAELDVARATAESDLAHLASACVEAVQATLDEVVAEAEQLECEGAAAPDPPTICAEEPEDQSDESGDLAQAEEAQRPSHLSGDAEQPAPGAEEAIARLRARIDRLGPVNMMAIEQFDELETRHTFLSAERKDLVDSIAQTIEAIRRIDATTRERFDEAFAAINHNFQETFSTLFGGGRAGLTLLDENDPLESGIEIIAQPPGKRLQSVQLLSGGEKALTAIALMFGLFKFKPSPFCLLDEIDAPLDDANIGRFVEMLRGMQRHTQFILITHNRKTMEIADRLYGVTMEEPGVSKLISVRLN